MKKKTIQIIAAIILIAVAIYRVSNQKPQVHDHSEMAMGTFVSIDIIDEDFSPEIMDSAFAIIDKNDSLLAWSNTTSEVNKINNAVENKVRISKTVSKILKTSKEISNITDGAFDVTIGIISAEYDFVKKIIPKASKIEEKIKHVNYKNIIFENDFLLKKDKDLKINLGGIAKGYIIDLVKDYLYAKNIEHFVINAGGDMYLTDKTNGDGWKIGIRHPRKEGELLGNIVVKNKAVVTSGDYEQYFFSDSIRIHHIIEPKTGLPAGKSISVTVIADKATYADAMCTAFFVMGPEKGIELANKINNMDAIFLQQIEDKLYYSTSNNFPKYNFTISDTSLVKL
ncbi:MAG: FAD:protein FMN transferase [Candidatus Cloacimonetes bacterium]|nr:FAD:protein FMN transferase [Candidatus Cloacimonadota bacterium]